MFRALRHRNFQLFYAGQAVSLTGTWMQSTAQSWLVHVLTYSAFWLGMIGFIGSLPVLLFSLLGGTIADRFHKRPLIVGTQTGAMILALILGLLTAVGRVQLWHVAVLAFLLGTVNAFDMPLRQAFVVEMVGKEGLGNAIALNSASFNSARMIGPAMAGPIIDRFGTADCFFANSASFLAVIVCLLLMKFPRFKSPTRTTSVWHSTLEGLRYARHTRPVLALLALVGIMTVFGWSYSVLLPIIADQILHRGAKGYGWLLFCNGIGALAAGLTLAAVTDRVRPRRLVFGGIGIFCISVTALALSRSFWLSALCMVFVGFGLVTFFATSNTSLQRRVPDEMRGRVMGIYVFAFGGFFPFGSLQTGLIAHGMGKWFGQAVGVSVAIIFGAVVCALSALIAARLVTPTREAVKPPQPPETAIAPTP